MPTTVIKLLSLSAGALTILVSIGARVESSTIKGKVLFLGTMSEYHPSKTKYQAMIRIKLRGECTPAGTNPAKSWDFWGAHQIGPDNTPWSHNGPNLTNAHNTLLTVLTTKKTVQIDGLGNCANLPPEGLLDNQELWNLAVGISEQCCDRKPLSSGA
jgi:hypothetical protein